MPRDRFELTRSHDGLRRLNLRLRERLTLDDLALFVTAELHESRSGVQWTLEDVRAILPSKTAAYRFVQDQIRDCGTYRASYTVGDNDLNEAAKLVRDRLRELWGE